MKFKQAFEKAKKNQTRIDIFEIYEDGSSHFMAGASDDLDGLYNDMLDYYDEEIESRNVELELFANAAIITIKSE